MAKKTPTVELPFPAPTSIDSREAADEALRELGEIAAQEERLSADFHAQSAELQKSYAGRLVKMVDGAQVSFADRRAALEAALEEFLLSHRDELLDGDKKSIELNHGTLGLRQARSCLVPAEKMPAAGNAKVLDAIAELLMTALKKFKLFKSLASEVCFKFSVRIDNVALLKAYEEKRITAAELKKAGKKYCPPEDKFFCDPKAPSIVSHLSPAPATP